MRRSLAILAMAMIVAAGCGDDGGGAEPSNDGTTPGAGSSTSAAPTTSQVQTDPTATINAIWYRPPLTLDPHQEPNSAQRPYWVPAYDTLFDIGDGSAQPMVATAANVSSDGLTLTLPLRTDVLFADGTPVDAAAVVASIEHARKGANAVVMNSVASVVSVTAKDTKTVEIVLKAPDPSFPAVLGGPAGAVINPKALANPASLATQTAGSGAYQSIEYVANSKVVYKRSSQTYWDSRGGKLAGLTIWSVADTQTTLNGLQSGQYDVGWVIGDRALLKPLEPTYKVYDKPAQGADSLSLRNTKEQLSDVRVRQAIAYAVDRQSISTALYGGDCAVTTQVAPKGNPMHLDSEPYSFDPAKAKQLLKDANAVGMNLDIVDVGTAASRRITQALQQQLNDVGFKANAVPGDTSAAANFSKGLTDSFVSNSPLRAHPLSYLSEFFLPGGGNDLAKGEDATLQTLVAKVKNPATSKSDVTQAYKDLGTELARLSIVVPMCIPNNHFVAKPTVVGLDFPQASNPNYRTVGVVKK